MPIFEFHCEECNETFESLMRPYDPIECIGCKSRNCSKLVSAPGAYKIKGDNSASTSPKTRANHETDRQMGKRERVMGIIDKQSKE